MTDAKPIAYGLAGLFIGIASAIIMVHTPSKRTRRPYVEHCVVTTHTSDYKDLQCGNVSWRSYSDTLRIRIKTT